MYSAFTYNAFFIIVSAEVNSCKTKPVSLSLIHHYSDTFFFSKGRNIASIPDLFDKEYLEYHDLLEACLNVNIQIPAEERKHIQEDTRNQSQGSSFYRHRDCKVGASISKGASHTNPAQPSLITTLLPGHFQVEQCS